MTKYKEEETSYWCSVEKSVLLLQAVLLAAFPWRRLPQAVGRQQRLATLGTQ